MTQCIETIKRYAFLVQGQVQGVGFRPFIYRLASRHGLAGSVQNTSQGVAIEIEGEEEILQDFFSQLKELNLTVSPAQLKPPENNNIFSILESSDADEKALPVSADRAICSDCLAELYQPDNRRYLYPFISCAGCGPRYTVIEKLPYDRPATTMKIFPMCPDCREEYRYPGSRRMHSQLNTCPQCGPQIYLVWQGKKVFGQEALEKLIGLLKEGKIAAIKGWGGFHLSCDATNSAAVNTLRERKNRPDKPLAIMSVSVEQVRKYAHCSPAEEKILSSPAHPIVLLLKNVIPECLNRESESSIAENVSPENRYFGVMLPYTPLQHLLFYSSAFLALVMTSGNRQEEPICLNEEQALANLSGIADCFLFHSYPINNRCDDSLVFLSGESEHQIRRARGYVPGTVASFENKNISLLACGPELKNTFCLVKNGQAYLSSHIGDLSQQLNYDFYKDSLQKYFSLLDFTPGIVAYDLHPDYAASRFAREFLANHSGRGVAVQHHYAHIGSVLAEHRLALPVIGIAFDGTGWGDDGNVWGGEIFLVNQQRFQRLFHLDYFPLPGGDAAAREIWRIVFSWFYQSGEGKLMEFLENIAEKKLAVVKKMLEQKINSPLTSSIGRLFDGVACLLGLNSQISYEARAASHLEFLAGLDSQHNPFSDAYNFSIKDNIIEHAPVWMEIIRDLKKGEAKQRIARKFHFAIIKMIGEVCRKIAGDYPVDKVVLSGGVFQNRILLEGTTQLLSSQGFNVYTNRRVPANDGGISLGQAWYALWQIANGE